ncbi:MAG: hypothetical protein WCH93_05425 [Actinomycetota bacterium]
MCVGVVGVALPATAVGSDGTLDTTFSTEGFDNWISAVRVLPNGQVLVGGEFTHFDPTGANLSVKAIARLNSDGTLDPAFNHGGFTGSVWGAAVQPDGKLVLVGNLSAFDPTGTNVAMHNVARLNSDGTLDGSLHLPNATSGVIAVALQSDGKILIGGFFDVVDSVIVRKIVRLNADGTVDNTFSHQGLSGGIVNSIIVQPDGKIVAAGSFTGFDPSGTPVTVNRIARLNSDGTLDASFNHGGFGASEVKSVAVQSDGRILVSGDFTQFDPGGTPVTVNRIARLNSDGTLDTSFNHGGFNGVVRPMLIQPDGNVVVGGDFTAFDPSGTPVTLNRIARLNSDGTLDTSFTSGGFDKPAWAIAIQSDGRLIVAGNFSSFDPFGTPVAASRIARLTGSSAQVLPPTGTNADGPLWLAAALLAAGAVLVTTRRRSHAAA